MTLARYFHTIRHLRAKQVYGRVWYRLYRPLVDQRPAPPIRKATAPWEAWAWRTPSMKSGSSFRFLNVDAELRAASDWDDPAQFKLWRYNLHYFDDLNAQGSADREGWHAALLQRWIDENPPGAGTGWEPYPVSLRIVNWIKWAMAAPGAQRLSPAAIQSLAVQARWLSKRLEIHILANHLWANAKALVFSGLFFEGPEAGGWLKTGAAILEDELDEQFLADGGHFERSPMYHATLLEDVLDLVNLGRAFPLRFPAALLQYLESTATRMLRWLEVMTHPDGGPSFFNDAAFGIAAEYRQIAAQARRLNVIVDGRPLAPLEVLPDSGYTRLQNDRAALICDVARVGPDYLPGHAHADTLSFELSIDGRRVLVNSGTSTYARGAERLRQRGTAAHNTVVVDGEDSSEVWDSFRVARRARPFDVKSGVSDTGPWLEGAHDGYRRLPGRVTHRRRWMLERGALSVEDRIDGTCRSAEAVFRLHPSSAAAASPVRIIVDPPAAAVTVPSTWHPEFGVTVETAMVVVPIPAGRLTTRIAW